MKHELSRRGFLGGIIAACAAPAIVRAGIIMPIKPPLVTSASVWMVDSQNVLAGTCCFSGLTTVQLNGMRYWVS